MESMMISIRHAEPADAEALHRILSEHAVCRQTLQIPYPPTRNQQQFLEKMVGGDDFLLVASVSEEVVGSLGLHIQKPIRCRHIGRLGMTVRSDWQRKGVGTALINAAIDMADNWLNLKRLELDVWTDNKAAIALYKKAGFAIEGTHRCRAFRDGQYIDAYSMARIREP